jgi:uncharacterized protein YdeI (YjbR/CyaY-like superfamily)
MNPELNDFFHAEAPFSNILILLRTIALDCGLTEELKWKTPCYTFKGKNILILGRFKASCVMSFFKGALLRDELGILEKPGENTQSGRVIRFHAFDDFLRNQSVLKAYIFDAIEVEKSGLKLPDSAITTIEMPTEFRRVFENDYALKTAFELLTRGRQRAYFMIVASAKSEKTRFDRIAKYRQRILDGFGIHDCTCGLSNKMPACDGSHRVLNNKL